MGIKGLASQLGTHLFIQPTHHRIRLLVGHEVPEGRATKKGGLIVAGHGSDWLRWVDHHRKKIKPLPVSEQRKAAPQGSFCNLGDVTDPKKVGL
jgi:hypothetical protein